MNLEQKHFHLSRRREFSKLIGKDSIAIIFGNTDKNKSYDMDYHFKQYKNFYYLTGFEEPNSALLLAPGGIKLKLDDKEKEVNEVLYVQKKDPYMETWTGIRLGYDNVKKELGIENGKVNEELSSLLIVNVLKNYGKLYMNFSEMIKLTGEMKHIITQFINVLNKLAPQIEIIDVAYLLGKMRAVKTSFEIKLIQKAANISIKAYNETIKIIKPELYEYQIQASLEYHYKFNGGEDVAYNSIVASGENACTLHYDSNDKILKKGELLLIDSASEYNYYASDITRTFPVDGKFSKEQKLIYEIVLKANKECIKKIKPGVKLSEIRELSEKILAGELHKEKILKDRKKIKTYSIHGVGHHIGLDVHDAVPSMKTLSTDNDTLKPGNVLTIEPGLYFSTGMKDIPKKFWDIGVRIEDDVLVTKNGCENLTKGMIKEVDEIESAIRRGGMNND